MVVVSKERTRMSSHYSDEACLARSRLGLEAVSMGFNGGLACGKADTRIPKR